MVLQSSQSYVLNFRPSRLTSINGLGSPPAPAAVAAFSLAGVLAGGAVVEAAFGMLALAGGGALAGTGGEAALGMAGAAFSSVFGTAGAAFSGTGFGSVAALGMLGVLVAVLGVGDDTLAPSFTTPLCVGCKVGLGIGSADDDAEADDVAGGGGCTLARLGNGGLASGASLPFGDGTGFPPASFGAVLAIFAGGSAMLSIGSSASSTG